MKLKSFISIMVCFVFAAGNIGAALAYDPISGAVSVTSRANIPLAPGPLLDDFSKGTGVNVWGDITGAFSEIDPAPSDGICTASYTDNPGITYGGTGYSLQLDYNVTRTDTFAGYFSKLGGADLSSYNYLSFWVRGTNPSAGEYFKIELHHANYDPDQAVGYNNNYKASVYVTDYLDGGVTTSWQKVVIPLDAFANIEDWTHIGEIVITFENWQSTANGSPLSGIVYIDNISFGYQFLGFVRIDHFGDKVSIDALGGNCSHTSGSGPIYGSYEYTNVANQYRDYANGLGFHFQDVVDPRYYAYYSIIGGGDTGFVQQPRDFSAYNRVTFWVRSNAADVNCLKMELHCPTGQNNYFHFFKNNITNTWQYFNIPLTEFTTSGFPGSGASIISSGKIYSLGEVTFTRDGWFSNAGYTDWDGGVSTGSFYIDKLQLEVNGYAPDTTLPAAPSIPVITGTGILTLTCTASSRVTDLSIENVRFEYNDGGWKTIGADYDTANSTYSAAWNTSGLSPGSYQVRAVAMDAKGNQTASNATTYVKP